MADEDSDTPCVSFFSNRAQLVPKKTPEELRAAEELLKMIEVEKNVQIDKAKPFANEAEPFGNKAESSSDKAESSGKKGRKKKVALQTAGNSQPGASSYFESSQPCKRSQSAASFSAASFSAVSSAAASFSAASSAVASFSAASSAAASSAAASSAAASSAAASSTAASSAATSSAAVDEKMIVDHEINQVRLSAVARKRLKKLKDDHERDLMLINAENAMILEGNPFMHSEVTEELPTIEEEKTFHVTVNYFNKVARFKCLENEKFYKVFQDVAEFFHLKSSEMLLCLNERNVLASDTPKSLRLSERDILECIPFRPEGCWPSTSSALDDDRLTITFQSNDSNPKVDVVVNRMQRMRDIMNEYASKRKMPLNEFKFEFDGEKLKGDETPAALDMESGDCIDVRVFVPLPQCSHASDDVFISQPQCSHASDDKPGDDRPSDNKDYFSIYYQDYTFVDSDSNGSDIQVLD